jgi:lipid-binding SYLF domain-containing protein
LPLPAFSVRCVYLGVLGCRARPGSEAALEKLLESNAGARALAKEAHAVLVLPRIVKGDFLFGEQCGGGTLLEGRHG